MSVRFGDITTNHRVHSEVDDNGTIHMAYWDEVNDDVIMLRLYRDADRDLVFDYRWSASRGRPVDEQRQ